MFNLITSRHDGQNCDVNYACKGIIVTTEAFSTQQLCCMPVSSFCTASLPGINGLIFSPFRMLSLWILILQLSICVEKSLLPSYCCVWWHTHMLRTNYMAMQFTFSLWYLPLLIPAVSAGPMLTRHPCAMGYFSWPSRRLAPMVYSLARWLDECSEHNLS